MKVAKLIEMLQDSPADSEVGFCIYERTLRRDAELICIQDADCIGGSSETLLVFDLLDDEA